MRSEMVRRPLFTWDEFTVRFDLDMVELALNRELPKRAPAVREVGLAGDVGSIEIRLKLEISGIPTRIGVMVDEIRLYRRFVGCRVTAIRGPFGLPAPLSFVAALLRRYAGKIAVLDPEDGVLLVNLEPYLPEGIDVRVHDVRCAGRWLEVEIARGSVTGVFGARANAEAEP